MGIELLAGAAMAANVGGAVGLSAMSDAQGGGEGGMEVKTVDPAKAMALLKQAGTDYVQKSDEGLKYYEEKIAQAQQQLQAGFEQGRQRLEPIVQLGKTAMNQYLRMLGLNDASPTQGMDVAVDGLGPEFAGIGDQIAIAEKLQDPGARANAKKQILDKMTFASGVQMQRLQKQKQDTIQQMEAKRPQEGTYEARKYTPSYLDDLWAEPERPVDHYFVDVANGWKKWYNQANQKWSEEQGAAVGAADKAIADGMAQMQGTIKNYSKNYSEKPNYFGYKMNPRGYLAKP